MSELYPESLQIKPMKYGKAPDDWKDKVVNGGYYAQIKKDGAHYILEKTQSGNIYLFGRTVSKRTGELTEKSDNVPHIVDWAKTKLPNGTILCGEVYYPGKTSKDVTKVMGAKPQKAIDRQKEKYGPVHYYIFDCLKYDGRLLINEPFRTRFDYIINCIFPTDTIEVAKVYYEEILGFVNEWLERGEEGAVIKRIDGLYIPDKRPSENFKVKQKIDSIDVVIMDLLDPKYEYTGKETNTWQYKDSKGNLITKDAYLKRKAGLLVGAYKDGELVPVGRVTSGITDKMKDMMTRHPHLYLNHTCSIQCMSVDKNEHTLRHAFFLNMREDKDAKDCLFEDIFS